MNWMDSCSLLCRWAFRSSRRFLRKSDSAALEIAIRPPRPVAISGIQALIIGAVPHYRRFVRKWWRYRRSRYLGLGERASGGAPAGWLGRRQRADRPGGGSCDGLPEVAGVGDGRPGIPEIWAGTSVRSPIALHSACRPDTSPGPGGEAAT